MTTPTLYELTGLSIEYNDPIIHGGSFRDTLTNRYTSYGHTISAWMGFDNARIQIDGNQSYVEEWFENGLLRDIVVKNQDGQVVWQGFVNQIGLTIAGASIIRGPVMNASNCLLTVYSAIDTSVYPNAIGSRNRTPVTNDLASQAEYGQLKRVLSGGSMLPSVAVQAQNTFMSENSLPEIASSISLGSAGASPSVTLSCLGYGYWFGVYPYNNTVLGVTSASVRLIAIATATPNAVFSTDYTNLNTNTLTIPSYENDDKPAIDYIKGIVALGDATNSRWTFGIYEDRMIYYSAIPTTIEYNYYLSNNVQQIVRANDQIPIKPWDVRPAKWVSINDFLIGHTGSSTLLRSDPRNMFIESVNFSAPFSIQLQGSKVSTLPQALARMGLGGTP